jgi:hypothetical protein
LREGVGERSSDGMVETAREEHRPPQGGGSAVGGTTNPRSTSIALRWEAVMQVTMDWRITDSA